MKRKENLRIFLVFIFFLFIFTVLSVRFFYWQAIKANLLRDLYIKQSSESFFTNSRRGDILFSDNYPLATTMPFYLLYANPKLIPKDKLYDYAKKISDTLDLKESSVSAKLGYDLFWVKLAENINRQDKAKIENLNLSGLGFEETPSRFYPEASLAAHLVGFVGKDREGKDKGYFGLEGYYDDQLKGVPGRLFAIHDAFGNPILNDIREDKKVDGRTLVLNIDRFVQFVAEQSLEKGVNDYGAQGGSVVIMEPQTGKIIAMASYPKFDPKNYYDFDPKSYSDQIIASLYEPGSTFKVLVMSAALDLGLVTPSTRCDICSGPISIYDAQVKTWNNKYYPNSTMTEVIQHSDNTGMVFVARKLGIDNLIKYLKLFGIGEKTKIDLEGEVSGNIKNKNFWYPIDLATASFGQGISVSPIQILSAVSAIANKGIEMKPYIVSKIITSDKKEIEIKPEQKTRVISEIASRMMIDMMVSAVENGEAKWTKIKGYNIAGKTGTAQISIKGHYDPLQTVASFVGFFPAKDPKVAMLVVLDKPKTSIYGSETAAPVFFSIARQIINYYKIPPDY